MFDRHRRFSIHRRYARVISATALAAVTIGALAMSAPAASTDVADVSPARAADPTVTTSNPITSEFADTYADPAVIRGKDGWWYMYATSDPLTEPPSEFGLMHVARSRDFTDWEYLGTIFDEQTRPDWTTDASYYWAPDIRYVDGRYVLYYTVTDTVADPGAWNYTIGVATAPTPTGPWTDSGGPVLDPRPAPGGGYLNTIDPALFVDDDGSRYLYFGGFNGGVWVTQLSPDGLRAVGEPTRVTIGDRYEGAFVVKRDGYYYLTASSANCCAGPVTGYSVYAGRSTSPFGPFVDHEGVSLNESRVGGTQVLAQNGNRWIGVGHHTIVTDLSGQDHIVYHGIDRNNAWLAEPGAVNRRPALIDRLDWIDGWPVTRAGAGPSDTPQPAPVTTGVLGIDSDDPADGSAIVAVAGDWLRGEDTTGDAGALARLVPDERRDAVVRTTATAPHDVRVETDVRLPDDEGAFTVELGLPAAAGYDITLDADARELVVSAGGSHTSAALPSTVDLSTWHALSVDLREGRAHIRLSSSRLGDVDTEVTLDRPRPTPLRAPMRLRASGAEAQIDNLTVAEAHSPVTEAVHEPVAGEMIFEESFDGQLDDGWRWMHQPDDVVMADGTLTWPLKSVDLVGTDRPAPALLRDQPDGDWVLETQVHLPLGADTIRNYQQAGLLVYVNDDEFLRLGTVAIWATRQVEFGKESTSDGRVWWGGSVGGPTADTVWLRLYHTVDPQTGEHRYRQSSSRDGQAWRFGGTWTLPADADPSIGIYAGGGATPTVAATFDFVRIRDAE